MESSSQDKQAAIDDNIRRTVERAALRKVRNVLDEVGTEEAAARKLRRLAGVISGVLLLLLMLFVASLLH
jgi:hypothetical protein